MDWLDISWFSSGEEGEVTINDGDPIECYRGDLHEMVETFRTIVAGSICYFLWSYNNDTECTDVMEVNIEVENGEIVEYTEFIEYDHNMKTEETYHWGR